MKNKEKKELASFLPIVWLNFRQYGGDVFAWREGEREAEVVLLFLSNFNTRKNYVSYGSSQCRLT